MKKDSKTAALALKAQGFGARRAAKALSMPFQTVSTWFYGRNAGHSAGHSTKVNAGHSAGQWMQSLHHDAAHFVIDGVTACSTSVNGAKVTAGDRWLQHDGCVKRCLRCMSRANASDHPRNGA